MKDYKTLYERQKELIEHLKLLNWQEEADTDNVRCYEIIGKLTTEIIALESEPEKAECSCNPEVIGSYANCPIHSPDIDLAEMNFNANFEKEAEERKTAEIPSDIVQKMQHEFEPNPDTSFKQGMYSGYAFGLQDGYKFASQSLPEIDDNDVDKEAYNYCAYPGFNGEPEFDPKANACFTDGAKWAINELKRRLK